MALLFLVATMTKNPWFVGAVSILKFLWYSRFSICAARGSFFWVAQSFHFTCCYIPSCDHVRLGPHLCSRRADQWLLSKPPEVHVQKEFLLHFYVCCLSLAVHYLFSNQAVYSLRVTCSAVHLQRLGHGTTSRIVCSTGVIIWFMILPSLPYIINGTVGAISSDHSGVICVMSFIYP